MTNLLKYYNILFVIIALFLTSCSSIMRPPPAAAFMDSYRKDNAVNSVGFTYYAGNLDNSYHEHTSYSHKSHAEWWGDFTFEHVLNSKYFSFGFGMQSLTPFLQGGFVSPYVGLTGWSNIFAIGSNPLRNSENESHLSHFSGGGMLIEQIPINENWKFGLTEHFSRNGRELYYVDEEACEGFSIGCDFPRPRPKFYREVGGGFFISRTLSEAGKASIEFRYGRDLDEKRNRFAITLDFSFSSPAIPGGNDVMRSIAQKNLKKMEQLKTISADSLRTDSTKSDSINGLHTIKRQWIHLADSNQTTSIVYKPTDNVFAVTTKGICYDESANAVWLKQDYANTIYQVSVDSLDYCQQMERKNLLGSAVLEGVLGTLLAGMITGSLPASIAIGAGFGTGFWAIFNFGFDPEDLAPKVYPELCSEKHSKEQIIDWLKQYPCGEELRAKHAP